MERPRPVPPVVRALAGSARQNRLNTSDDSPGRKPDAVIAHRDRHDRGVGDDVDVDRTALTVLGRIDQQVAQNPLDATAIGLADARFIGHVHRDDTAAAGGEWLGRIDNSVEPDRGRRVRRPPAMRHRHRAG